MPSACTMFWALQSENLSRCNDSRKFQGVEAFTSFTSLGRCRPLITRASLDYSTAIAAGLFEVSLTVKKDLRQEVCIRCLFYLC